MHGYSDITLPHKGLDIQAIIYLDSLYSYQETSTWVLRLIFNKIGKKIPLSTVSPLNIDVVDDTLKENF